MASSKHSSFAASETTGSIGAAREAALEWLLGRINYERTAFVSYQERQLKLDRMRQLVAALNSQLASSKTARVANFVTWANDRLTELEAAISAATLEEKFEEARLFGDDDDYKFVSPPFYSY